MSKWNNKFKSLSPKFGDDFTGAGLGQAEYDWGADPTVPGTSLTYKDAALYAGSGTVLAVIAHSLGAGLVGSLAAGVAGIGLAAFVILHPPTSSA